MVQMNGYAVNAETPLDLLTDYLTPNHLFFVRSHWVPHPPDVHGWTLSVDGDVATAMQLTGSDLRRMPVTEVTWTDVGRWPFAVGRGGAKLLRFAQRQDDATFSNSGGVCAFSRTQKV